MGYLSEVIYGGVDGIITTFAIVSGAAGANMSSRVPMVIGASSLIADGFSMGVSSYLAEQARVDNKNPFIVGLTTFVSFVMVGIIPLIPFIVSVSNSFMISSIMMGISLLFVGMLKSVSHGLQTLVLGASAAFISYKIGEIFRKERKSLS
jgi:vacuolar iron transporter family protein